jgi:hypothetical protein
MFFFIYLGFLLLKNEFLYPPIKKSNAQTVANGGRADDWAAPPRHAARPPSVNSLPATRYFSRHAKT